MLLLVWVVEARRSGVGPSAETALVHLILFIHQHYTVVLLMTVPSLKRPIYGPSYRAASIREFTSCLFVWFV